MSVSDIGTRVKTWDVLDGLGWTVFPRRYLNDPDIRLAISLCSCVIMDDKERMELSHGSPPPEWAIHIGVPHWAIALYHFFGEEGVRAGLDLEKRMAMLAEIKLTRPRISEYRAYLAYHYVKRALSTGGAARWKETEL
jgi:hypothetical protein